MNSKNTLNVGFELSQHKNNSRVQVLKLSKNTVEKFSKKIVDYNVQSIEYKPFLRFYLADCLNKLTDDTLGKFLLKTLKNRSTGAILLECELLNNSTINGIEFLDFNVLLSTAISHLIGIPNLDSMSGKFYARFSVKNEDNSDSYLRQAHRRMELHNDGTYVEETTDWVIMQKILEVDVEGGDSLLLLSLIHI